jgi:negative regulator of sigma E activity
VVVCLQNVSYVVKAYSLLVSSKFICPYNSAMQASTDSEVSEASYQIVYRISDSQIRQSNTMTIVYVANQGMHTTIITQIPHH